MNQRDTRVVVVKTTGQTELATRVLQVIEDNFNVIRRSQIMPNDQGGILAYQTIIEEVRGRDDRSY